MNAPKFTPGPWRNVPTTTHGIDLVTIRRDIVSDGAEFAPAFVAGDITPEDAVLIAAAPELYAALSEALWMIVQHEGTSDVNDRIVDAVRAALAKAEAVQP